MKAYLLPVALALCSTAVANIEVTPYAGLPLAPGRSFDGVAFQDRESPFALNTIKMAPHAPATNVWAKKHEITHQVARSRVVSGNAAGSYSWLTGSASVSASNLNQSVSSKNSYSLALEVVADLGSETIAEIMPHPDAVEAARTDPKEFVKTYGDHYIKTIYRGGRFVALVKITSSIDETRDEIAATLNLSSVADDFSAVMRRLNTMSEARYAIQLEIFYSGAYENLPNLKELEHRFQTFPDRVRASPSVYKAEALPLYNHPAFRQHLAEVAPLFHERQAAVTKLYGEIEETDLKREDFVFLRSLSSRKFFDQISAPDRRAIERIETALDTRAVALRQAFRKVVDSAEVPSLESIPRMPAAEVEVFRENVTASNDLMFIAKGKSPYQHGNTTPGGGKTAYSSEITVDNGAVILGGKAQWLWHERSGTGHYTRIDYSAEPRVVRRLRKADYYLLPNGEASWSIPEKTAGESLREVEQPIEANDMIWSAVRHGEGDVTFSFRPFRVTAIVFHQLAR